MTAAAIAAGGALGAVARHLLTKLGLGGLLAANVAACALLGWCAADPPPGAWAAFLGAGVAGALSTWSTLAARVGDLWSDGRRGAAAGYLGLTAVLGLAAAGVAGVAGGM
ncbi:CrcB family protein [Corynebacterium sp.]|uniref:FluC/FEX family fluoride channel n=1 Tax=Corynebacterium sp. TaxID=1720 RepID=UPI0026DD71E2|nr:CrcB family protein [Corynebacterium sp.]MDO4611016.1 CrcB family protein [Corynebacterium sp.]